MVIPEYRYDLPHFLTEGASFSLQATDIEIRFTLEHDLNPLIVESSFKDELPELMMIGEITYASERIVDWPLICEFAVIFNNEDLFQAVKLSIPLKFRHCKLFLSHVILFAVPLDPLIFQGENIHVLSDDNVWIDIDGKEEITFFVSRNPNTSTIYSVQAFYCQFEAETLFLTPSGSTVNLGSNAPTLIIYPLFQGYFYQFGFQISTFIK